MKYIFNIVLLFLIISFYCLNAQTYYVDYANGSDSYPGTISQPFKLISKALSTLGSNIGTIYLRAGTHYSTAKINLNKNGTSGNMIKLWAYESEKPIINFAGIATNTDGFSISGTYYHLKGLEIINATHNAINISGHNNIMENCSAHQNGNTGIHITGSTSFPSNNLILNCDSYMNFDSPIGGNADGFSAKWNVGSGNVFRGCRAYNNSDDGWDLWMCTSTITIENCYAFRNGVDIWHTGQVSGNGNGFKLGGNNVATPHIVKNCLSFDNAGNTGRGFDENNNLAGQTLYNCTSFRNLKSNFYFNNNPLTSGSHSIVNCVSYVSGLADVFKNTVAQTNSWQGFTVNSADFISLDTTGITGARNADGSLPSTDFLHLATGSDLIDAGTNVEIPFNGDAPDLGYFESSSPVPVELISFNANSNGEIVFLNWITSTEVNNLGFEVERCLFPTPSRREGAFKWERIGIVSGNGNSNSPKQYSFVDKSHKQCGLYFYRLKQIDADGKFEHSDEVEVMIEAPITYTLNQNYPNPFNPTTTIEYALPMDSKVTLELYSIVGEKIADLVKLNQSAGFYAYQLSTSNLNLTSGIYLYKLSAVTKSNEVFSKSMKMLLLK